MSESCSIAGRAGGTGAEARLRPFPYPYRAMLALCSDIDQTTVARFRALHKFLNTHEDTVHGPGLGLDIADSFWFYRRPSSASTTEPTTAEVAYFTGYDWTSRSTFADELLSYCRAGWIDSLHTYGNFSGAKDAGNCFTRQHAENALRVIKEEELSFPVWINHGDSWNRQNIGDRDYMEGDRPGAAGFHWDLLRETDISYLWRSGGTFNFAQNHPLAIGRLNSGDEIFQFQRYHTMPLDEASQLGMLPPVLRRIRQQGRTYAALWHPQHLHLQLNAAALDRLSSEGGFAIVAQHLGAIRPMTELGASAVGALRNLAARQASGDILVARTSRLLKYAHMRDYLRATVRIWDDREVIDVEAVRDPLRGERCPSIDDIRGVTFYCRDSSSARLCVGGRDVSEADLIRNPHDGTAPSIGIKWFPADSSDYTVPYAELQRKMTSMSLDADSIQKSVLNFIKGQSNAQIPGIEPSIYEYALNYTRDRYKVGLAKYTEVFRALGFKDNAKGLDVGSGAGHWGLAFLQQNQTVEGIDVRPEFTEISRRIVRHLGLEDRARFVDGRAEELPYDDKTFNVVWSHGVLMFTEHDKSIREIARVLKPGGYFYCGYSSFGFRAHGPLHGLSVGNLRAAQAQVANLVGDRLYRCGIGRNSWSNTRAHTLEELLGLCELFGMSFVDKPGLQDGSGTVLEMPGTIDLLVRLDADPSENIRRLAAAPFDEVTLEELAHLVEMGAPGLVSDLLVDRVATPDDLPREFRRLLLLALVKSSRLQTPVAAQLAAREDDPLLNAKVAFERRDFATVVETCKGLLESEPQALILAGFALRALGRNSDAVELFGRGTKIPEIEVGAHVGLLDAAGTEGIEALRDAYGEFLHLLGLRAGLTDEAAQLVSKMRGDQR